MICTVDQIDAAQRHQVLLLAPELDLLPMALALSLLERGYDLFIPISASTRLDAPGLARLKAAGVLFVDERNVLEELAFTSSSKTDRDVER